MRFLWRLALVLSLVLSSWVPAIPIHADGGSMVDRAGDARHRIRVVLQTDGAPRPGGVANLTFQATPLLDAPDLQIDWLLPAGGELLGGPAGESLGRVAAGQTVQLARQVRFPKAGVYQVMAVAGYQPAVDMQFSAVGVLFFTLRADGKSVVSDRDPTAVSPSHTVMATQVVRQTAPTAISPNADPCFTQTRHEFPKVLAR